MPSADNDYKQLCEHARELALLRSIDGLLGWDQQTKMPPAAGEYRAEQMSYLSGLIHQKQTDPRLGEWLSELADSDLAADPHSETGANIRQTKRLFEKKTRLPQSLVQQIARTTALAQQVWVEARKADDFAKFQSPLEQIIGLKREEAQAVGFEQSIYDPLLDDYEPEAATAQVAEVLAALREQLVPLVEAIQESGREPEVEILKRTYPADVQRRFGTDAARAIGFDFQRGRLDVTHHPFCGGAGPHDVRITTRYDEHFFNTAFFGILHEAGHGLYEQGLPADSYGLPAGESVSLGIHESQSRMWENLVGRSRAFWDHFYPQAQQAFPGALGDVAADAFYAAINDVRPSLIRVEADEATYNLHILVRFELEQALLQDDLKVADLPAAWNEKYRDYLGIDPPSDADGVLQDIHWSAGLIGYFPTYSLGNLYASQMFEKADADLGGLHAMFSRGEFQPLLAWLRDNVHLLGQRWPAAEQIEKVTGEPLSPGPLMRHLRGKFEPLYGLQ